MIRHIVANTLTLMIVGLIGLAVVHRGRPTPVHRAGALDPSHLLPGGTRGQPATGFAQLAKWGQSARRRCSASFWARYTDRADQLRFGSYLVPEAGLYGQIMDLLTRGGRIHLRI